MEQEQKTTSTNSQDLELVRSWVEDEIRSAIESAGATLTSDSAERLRASWDRRCREFAAEGRVAVRIRASRKVMGFHLAKFGEAIVAAAASNTVSPEDVTRGMLDYSRVKAFTPQCPFPWEIEEAAEPDNTAIAA